MYLQRGWPASICAAPTLSAAQLRTALPRGGVDVDAVVPTVRPIVDAVAEQGADAALEYGERSTGCGPRPFACRSSGLERALAELAADVRAALEVAIERARAVHADQRRTDTTTTLAPGATVTERWVPVERVGLYVPGGNAVYPSSVVMNVVPAQTAGVDSLVIASPPQAEFGGLPHPTILAAAALLGVDEVWAVGGAQSVALLAYGGTDTDGSELAPVDMITGPGNIYVTAAKRICRSQVGIDAEAGPTEIAILADHTADPVHVAADLISQAEHDEMAASVLVTPSQELADAIDRELAVQLETTVHRERVTAALTGKQSAIVLVDDVDAGVRTVNAYAAEHLEIQTVDASRRRGPDPFGGRDLRRPVCTRQPRRLLRGLEPRAAHRGLRTALQRPERADVPQGHPRRGVRRGRAQGRLRATSSRCRRPRTCPRTARRCGGGSRA